MKLASPPRLASQAARDEKRQPSRERVIGFAIVRCTRLRRECAIPTNLDISRFPDARGNSREEEIRFSSALRTFFADSSGIVTHCER